MIQSTKQITAIATTINGQINYICGQSITEANKYVPRYTRKQEEIKEFDNTGAAQEYINRISTSIPRRFTIIQVSVKENTDQAPPPVLNKIIERLTILIACIVLVSCSSYNYNYKTKRDGCPSTNENNIHKFDNRKFKA